MLAKQEILKRQRSDRKTSAKARLVKDPNPRKGMTLQAVQKIGDDEIITKYPCIKSRNLLNTDTDHRAYYQVRVKNGFCHTDFDRIIAEAGAKSDKRFDLYGPFANTKNLKAKSMQESKDSARIDYCNTNDKRRIKALKSNQKFDLCIWSVKPIRANKHISVYYGPEY